MQGTTIIARPFVDALNQIPAGIAYKHHGRDPGRHLDCCGLIFAIYSKIGLPIDSVDIPYGERDYLRAERTRKMAERLRLKFRPIVAKFPGDLEDGDVLLMGEGDRIVHCAIVIGGDAVQMTGHTKIVRGRHRIVGGRLMKVPLRKAFPFIGSAWRHGTLFHEGVIE